MGNRLLFVLLKIKINKIKWKREEKTLWLPSSKENISQIQYVSFWSFYDIDKKNHTCSCEFAMNPNQGDAL